MASDDYADNDDDDDDDVDDDDDGDDHGDGNDGDQEHNLDDARDNDIDDQDVDHVIQHFVGETRQPKEPPLKNQGLIRRQPYLR